MSLIHNRWLAEQLPAWEREGLVSADGARRLRERYAVEPQAGLAQVIVGAVGALLIGTGLIAVIAYNWDDFPRWVRLGLALGPLAATQAVSWLVLGRGDVAKPWHREAAALVQTLAVGAAIALVSQIYNLPGKWTDLVFWWCVVSVPLAWVMKSNAVAIAYLIGIAVWTVTQAFERANYSGAIGIADVRLWFPLLLAGVLPLWPGPDLRARPAPGSRLVLAGSALIGTFEGPARDFVKGVGVTHRSGGAGFCSPSWRPSRSWHSGRAGSRCWPLPRSRSCRCWRHRCRRMRRVAGPWRSPARSCSWPPRSR
ncbi:MAG: DUF2157 domain-containing protein [Planctomycetaceae bacterium]